MLVKALLVGFRKTKFHCYLATKPEVGLRDQGLCLPEVESLKIQSLWLLRKAVSSREELLLEAMVH